jgi:hypothetical protein
MPAATKKSVEELHQAKGDDVADAISRLLAAKHTGAVVIHLTQGRMQVVEWRKKVPDE